MHFISLNTLFILIMMTYSLAPLLVNTERPTMCKILRRKFSGRKKVYIDTFELPFESCTQSYMFENCSLSQTLNASEMKGSSSVQSKEPNLVESRLKSLNGTEGLARTMPWRGTRPIFYYISAISSLRTLERLWEGLTDWQGAVWYPPKGSSISIWNQVSLGAGEGWDGPPQPALP